MGNSNATNSQQEAEASVITRLWVDVRQQEGTLRVYASEESGRVSLSCTADMQCSRKGEEVCLVASTEARDSQPCARIWSTDARCQIQHITLAGAVALEIHNASLLCHNMLTLCTKPGAKSSISLPTRENDTAPFKRVLLDLNGECDSVNGGDNVAETLAIAMASHAGAVSHMSATQHLNVVAFGECKSANIHIGAALGCILRHWRANSCEQLLVVNDAPVATEIECPLPEEFVEVPLVEARGFVSCVIDGQVYCNKDDKTLADLGLPEGRFVFRLDSLRLGTTCMRLATAVALGVTVKQTARFTEPPRQTVKEAVLQKLAGVTSITGVSGHFSGRTSINNVRASMFDVNTLNALDDT